MIPARISPAELTAACRQLERQAAEAEAAIRVALAAGDNTASLRASLSRIQGQMRANAERIAAVRAEAEARALAATAEARAAVAERGSEIARASAERLKMRLAMLAPPRAPRILREGGR